MIGEISAFQSMGAVDGPGVRCVVFMQGCPLRCVYCHNPETWISGNGQTVDTKQLVKKILRYRSFICRGGGVTVSGGEPLVQADFCADLFRRLKQEGIHTALDTSGMGNLDKAEEVLEYTDLVLCDLKFSSEEDYKKYCHGSLRQVLNFLDVVEKKHLPVWIRHVVVPGLTDDPENIRRIQRIAMKYSSVEKIELLPFKKICLSKYEDLGLEFPLQDVPECGQQTIENLYQIIEKNF